MGRSADLDDVHGLAAALEAELDRTRLEREQRVVAAAADAVARVEVRAALADEDLARVDDLPSGVLRSLEVAGTQASIAVTLTWVRC